MLFIYLKMRHIPHRIFGGLVVLALALVPMLGTSQSLENLKNAHCYGSCPQGAHNDNSIVIRPIYTVSYNTLNRSADWVAYTVTADSIGIASSLSREPVPDDFVAETLTLEDFAEDSPLGMSRYVPLVDFAGTPFWQDINYLTNIVPRTKSLSQGAWYGLNWAIRNAVNRLGEIYVITGPVYYPEPVVSPLTTERNHRVPDGFFKVVISADGGLSTFVFEQQTPVHVHHCDLESSLETIEALTGYTLIPGSAVTSYESISSALGCF